MKKIPIGLLAIIVLPLLVAGCGPSKKGSPVLGKAAVLTAQKYLGTPYVYGGRSPSGFDCSGLVWYVYRQHGINLPDASWKQVKSGRPVAKQELVPGDLIFFQSGGRVNHVGLYAGGGQMIHAPGKGRKVSQVKLSQKYYVQHFDSARRVFP